MNGRGEWTIDSQNLATRFVKTLAYWPFEEEHAGDGPLLASVLVLSCLLLGIVASFQNLFLGLGLATGCLYGSALARYFSR